MDEIRSRVVKCFQLVFPDVPESEIPALSQASVAAWDSVAAITLINVVEDEFQIQMDLDKMADLDSFELVCDYVRSEIQPA
jgi:acyl carrier protein